MMAHRDLGVYIGQQSGTSYEVVTFDVKITDGDVAKDSFVNGTEIAPEHVCFEHIEYQTTNGLRLKRVPYYGEDVLFSEDLDEQLVKSVS